MSTPIEQIITAVIQNPSVSGAVAGTGSIAALALNQARKMLIERFSERIGINLNSFKMIETAKAEGEAEIIRARSEVEAEKIRKMGSIEVSVEEERALRIHINQLTKEQGIVDTILLKALESVNEGAKPQDIDEDWLNNFVDKCRLTSDEEMQELWAKILAGEANQPGRYSKRAVNIIQSLDKNDAHYLETICRFCIDIHTEDAIIRTPLIFGGVFEKLNEVYPNNGLVFDLLNNLEGMGIINSQLPAMNNGFVEVIKKREFQFTYGSEKFSVKFAETEEAENTEFPVGKVIFTKLGHEISSLCAVSPTDEFREYFLKLLGNYKKFEINSLANN